MKYRIQLIAVLFTAVSAAWAMGCGCSSQKVHLQPVREKIISSNACSLQNKVVINRTAYVPECPSCVWVPPSTDNPGYVVGNVLTAPFRWITGRSLGQPDVVKTYNYAEPVGEKFTTLTTKSTSHFTACGSMTKKITLRSDSMLLPVGERLTTVKVIRLKPMPMPVAEQITTIRRVEMKPVCEPVGEKTIIRTTRIVSEPALCDY